MSVPTGATVDDVPVGLQIIARPGAAAALLEFVTRHVPIAPATPPVRERMGP